MGTLHSVCSWGALWLPVDSSLHGYRVCRGAGTPWLWSLRFWSRSDPAICIPAVISSARCMLCHWTSLLAYIVTLFGSFPGTRFYLHPFIAKEHLSWWDGPAGRGTCHRAWQPSSILCYSTGGRREPAPTSCPLTSVCRAWYIWDPCLTQ